MICTEAQVKDAIVAFIGTYEQLPPMYSAIKVDGKRLYELARQGKEVERKTRPVTMYEIEVLKMELPNVAIRVLCSKGTYIRTLCHDIGQKLGCGATMISLERTMSGQFSKDTAYTLDEIASIREKDELDSILISVDSVFAELPAMVMNGELEKKILNGNFISWRQCKGSLENEVTTTPCIEGETETSLCCDGQLFRIYKENKNSCNFMAVYRYDKSKKGIVPEKMFLG